MLVNRIVNIVFIVNLTIAMSLVLPFLGVAQEKGEKGEIMDFLSLYAGLYDEKPSPNYLSPISVADSLLRNAEGSRYEKQVIEAASMFYSFVGEYQKALEHYSKIIDTTAFSTSESLDFAEHEIGDAMQEILENAYRYDIIMIDDARHRPEHRVFAGMLLEELQYLGYSKIAFDDIYQTSSIIKLTKIPDENLGGLMIEPNYANLIRESFRLGYDILPHAYIPPINIKTRDSIDALGIFDHQNNNMSKIIIYCTSERMDKSKKTLVYWLELLSGKDVLIVNQTQYNEEFDRAFESPIYREAVDHNTSKVPFILKRKNTDNVENSDFFVFHPRTNYDNGRASWLIDYQLSNKRFLTNLPKELLKEIPANSIVQVFLKKEFDNGIPIDQFIYKKTSADVIPIVLPFGEFVLVIENINRSRLLTVEFTYDSENGLRIIE